MKMEVTKSALVTLAWIGKFWRQSRGGCDSSVLCERECHRDNMINLKIQIVAEFEVINFFNAPESPEEGSYNYFSCRLV